MLICIRELVELNVWQVLVFYRNNYYFCIDTKFYYKNIHPIKKSMANLPKDIQKIIERKMEGARVSTLHKKKLMLYYMAQTLCNISQSAVSVGIDRNTHYIWCNSDSKYATAVHDLKERVLDFTESALLKEVQGGNITAIIYHLKTQGKSRGYIETTHNIVTPVSANDAKNKSVDELLAILHRDPSKAF